MPQKDLRRLLNLSYTILTNQGHCKGDLDLPETICNIGTPPDYLALYDELGYYKKTPNTCVCFYRYDKTFDGINGLYNAIYYDDEKLLDSFRERFRDVRYFIAPDYSQCGDIHRVENHYRLFKARIVSLWLTLELGASVIPNLTYSRAEEIDLGLDGLEGSSVIGLSTKGALDNSQAAALLIKATDRALERLPLKTIIVYTTSADDKKVLALLKSAVDAGVDIVIPDNAFRIHRKNQSRRREGRNG